MTSGREIHHILMCDGKSLSKINVLRGKEFVEEEVNDCLVPLLTLFTKIGIQTSCNTCGEGEGDGLVTIILPNGEWRCLRIWPENTFDDILHRINKEESVRKIHKQYEIRKHPWRRKQ